MNIRRAQVLASGDAESSAVPMDVGAVGQDKNNRGGKAGKDGRANRVLFVAGRIA